MVVYYCLFFLCFYQGSSGMIARLLWGIGDLFFGDF